MSDDKPAAPNMRSFSLNEHRSHAGVHGEKRNPEAYEAMGACEDRPWIPNGALPREPRWPRADDGVFVNAETDDAAADAVGEWRRHVDAGRIGGRR
jgi:hypothetical protein